METLFVNFNGEILPSTESVFTATNRAFRYGDSIFETMRSKGLDVLFFDLHLTRLFRAMGAMEFDIPAYFTKPFLQLQIEKLLKRSRLFAGAKLRLSVFRADGGLYLPTNNSPMFIIEAEKLDEQNFGINKTGLSIGLYTRDYKGYSSVSAYKTSNSLLFILASLYKQREGFDDVILTGRDGRIVEATASNVFILFNGALLTPSICDGCVDGIMRKVVLDISGKLGIEIISEKPLFESDIINAEEVFFTNAVQGIRWVSAYGGKRYYKKVAEKITMELNHLVF